MTFWTALATFLRGGLEAVANTSTTRPIPPTPADAERDRQRVISDLESLEDADRRVFEAARSEATRR